MMLPSRVAIAVSLHHIFEPGERVVVAVSGGPDSLGLGAMRRRDRDLARPLLDISRHDIEAYLARLHLTPRRDPSNEDPRFTRNRLRQQLLPAIDAFDPAARELLARTADILGEEDRYLDDAIAHLSDDLVRDRVAFAKLPPALQRRLVRRLVPA